jgi:hypothetical protein
VTGESHRNRDVKSGSDEERAFAVLLSEYELLRQEVSSSSTLQIALVVSGTAVYGAVLATLLRTHDNWAFALLPLLPTFNLGWLLYNLGIGILRDFQLRAIERELHRRTGNATLSLTGADSMNNTESMEGGLPIPSTVHMEHAATAHRTAPRDIRMVSRGGYLVYICLWAITVIYSLRRVGELWVWIPASVFYLWLLYNIMRVARNLLSSGEKIWEELLRAVPEGFVRPLDLMGISARRDRIASEVPEMTSDISLAWYLILPRPMDLLQKALLIGPITAILGLWLATGFHGSRHLLIGQVGHIFLVLLIWEFFIYQARYQVNDLLGAEEEILIPDRGSRRRLPLCVGADPTGELKNRNQARKGLSVLVIAIKIGLAAGWFCVYASSREIVPLTACWVVLYVVVVIYEVARRRSFRVGEREYKSQAFSRNPPRWSLFAIYGTIGVGYGLRTVVALGTGNDWHLSLISEIAAFGFMYLVGTSACMMTWALFSGSYIPAQSVIPAHEVLRTIALRPHIQFLTIHCGFAFPSSKLSHDIHGNQGKVALLETQVIGIKPWRWLFVFSMSMGGQVAELLSRSSLKQPTGWSWVLVSSMLTAVGGILLVAMWMSNRVKTLETKDPSRRVCIALLYVAALAIVTCAMVFLHVRWPPLVLPVAVTFGSYKVFHSASSYSLSGIAVREGFAHRRDKCTAAIKSMREELGK